MTTTEKSNFHKRWTKTLRSIALELGILGECDIRSNQGGDAILGEVTLHGEKLYLQVGGSMCEPGNPTVLFRSCKGRKDYCGGNNRYMNASMLHEPRGMALLRDAAERSGMEPSYGRPMLFDTIDWKELKPRGK
jgi:hypothetical protein